MVYRFKDGNYGPHRAGIDPLIALGLMGSGSSHLLILATANPPAPKKNRQLGKLSPPKAAFYSKMG